jgi:hypothetical protein
MSSVRSDQTEYIWFLQLRNKGLERRLESFESGRAYVNLREKYETELRRVEAVVKNLRHQLTASHEQIKKNRECWFEVFEDMEEEQGKRIDGFLKEIKALKERERIVKGLAGDLSHCRSNLSRSRNRNRGSCNKTLVKKINVLLSLALFVSYRES